MCISHLGDSKQVLQRTTSLVFDICKAVPLLATATLIPLQGTLKDNRLQGSYGLPRLTVTSTDLLCPTSVWTLLR